MYQNHFGLNEQAFSIAVNPRYLYMSQQHKEALAHLLYGVKEGGFVMLTGEVGTGKTTIIRCLLEQLPENTEIAIILNPMANILELLCTICDEYSIQYHADNITIKSTTDLLHQHLLYNHRQGKNTVLLVDEAQLLSAEVLEQVRLLTNLETATQKLLQIVLVGQPELNQLLSQPQLRQLSQRITARFHLTPLTVNETQSYISHRLSVAGMIDTRPNPFPNKIVKKIHRFTGGVPRMINVLCERALIGAYGQNKSLVDADIFKLAKKEVEGNKQSNLATQANHPYLIYSLLSACGIVGLAVIFLMVQTLFSPAQQNTVAIANEMSSPILPIIRQSEPELRSNNNSTIVARQSDDKRNSTKTPGYDIENNITAQVMLFKHLKFDINTETHPCWQLNSQGYECSKTKLNTWEEIIALNRPVVLSLINNKKFRSYAVLIGIQDENALVIDGNSERKIIALEHLGPLWTGNIFYLWKKPKTFNGALVTGSNNPAIAEVAAQFALLDSQPTPLTTKTFNKALKERITIFQREQNLKADGILGARTLMKLNEALGLSTILEKDFL